MQDLDTEEAWVLMMNPNFKLIKASCLSHGGITETAVDIRLLIKEAVLNNATIIAFVTITPVIVRCPARQTTAHPADTEGMQKSCVSFSWTMSSSPMAVSIPITTRKVV